MKKLKAKAFTLIELLIVIAIIGVLAVTVILALNPAEAQKKARDTQRLKDATTLQAILEQLIDSGAAIPAGPGQLGDAVAPGVGVQSSTLAGSNVNIKSQNCNNAAASPNWLGVNVCAFAKNVPLDPANGNTRATSDGLSATTVAQTMMFYRAVVSGSNYEINVRQESIANWQKLNGDGGTNPDYYEVFSGDSALF